ncbi:DUF924 family protein [Agrobacterium bohemicum]|uniref:SpoVR like family protein n=1 Tax=Agrobacterium bohemicum TaxID=2052828 RepID=A0A135NZB6_9HYPH|nr:DUF924 family protein [Agrobacterium bohemicum]KXG84479.1 hypothetical protein ATO67_13320 [Agrobacterium bohemicum]
MSVVHPAPSASDVLSFWKDAGPEKWFDKDAHFDATFHDRFRDLHFAAARCELKTWFDGAESSLALLLLLDQFPRNCFRGTAHMYATDPLARQYTQEALRRGHDRTIDPELRIFFYLPLMHSEDLGDQHLCCKLCEPLGERYLPFAIEHRDIIERFGRFPHRNEILLRDSTDEEKLFLEKGGFAG